VTTDDGYILNLERIPGKLDEKDSGEKPVVLLMHGFSNDHMFWVENLPQQAQAFVLAEAGYDVWLGDNRGNRWSDKHVHMNRSQKEYWNFSWEEMGTKDVPAFISKIKAETGADKINYICHSEGCS